MSVKDIIFVVLAACLMCYLHRRDMLGRAAAELGTVVSVLAVWLVLTAVTWKLMAYVGVPLPVALATEVLARQFMMNIFLQIWMGFFFMAVIRN